MPHPSAATYHIGSDDGDLARRARELGLQRRDQRRLMQSDAHTADAGALMTHSGVHLSLLSALDPDLEDEDNQDTRRMQLVGMVRRKSSTPTDGIPTPDGKMEMEDYHHAPSGNGDGTNIIEAFLAIIKATIGPAVLYMPRGFEEGGISFSLPMIVASYTLFAWGALCLLEAWRAHGVSYAGLMGKAYGKSGINVVRFIIVCQQCGICLTYFIFVATNLQELLRLVNMHVSLGKLCIFQLMVYVPLTWIRDLQKFTFTNFLANFLILYSLLVLSGHAAFKVGSGNGHAPTLFNPNQFYLFVGTSAFIFEGVMALVVPLQETMRPDLQDKFPRLFVATLGGIVVLYITFGLLNWVAYGSHTDTVLTVNLPSGPWKDSVQIAYSIAVMFTFPLQLYPAIQIIKSTLIKARRTKLWQCAFDCFRGRSSGGDWTPLVSQQRKPNGPRRTWFQVIRGNVFRAVLVLILCGMAISVVTMLDRIVALLGGFLGIPLAFIFPSLIHLKIVDSSPRWVQGVNKMCIVLGAVLCVVCSAITIATW